MAGISSNQFGIVKNVGFKGAGKQDVVQEQFNALATHLKAIDKTGGKVGTAISNAIFNIQNLKSGSGRNVNKACSHLVDSLMPIIRSLNPSLTAKVVLQLEILNDEYNGKILTPTQKDSLNTLKSAASATQALDKAIAKEKQAQSEVSLRQVAETKKAADAQKQDATLEDLQRRLNNLKK